MAKAPHSFARGGRAAHGGGAIAGNSVGRNSVAPARNFQSPAPLATAETGRSLVTGRAGTAPATALRGQNQRPAPSVAYGGQSNYGTGRTNNRGFLPPVTVSRGWDHGRNYSWNNHQYGWRNNAWLIIDGGYGYGYPYGYGSPAPIYPSGYSMPNSYGLRESVQQALDQDGYQAGPPDGVIGQQTRNAIAAFQSDHGLNPTGQINPPLLSALGIQ